MVDGQWGLEMPTRPQPHFAIALFERRNPTPSSAFTFANLGARQVVRIKNGGLHCPGLGLSGK